MLLGGGASSLLLLRRLEEEVIGRGEVLWHVAQIDPETFIHLQNMD